MSDQKPVKRPSRFLQRIFRLNLQVVYKLAVKNIELANRYYLNGFRVWDYYASDIFSRLDHYLGHGLCYEASALEMLIWHGQRNTRLVFAECRGDDKTRLDHAWIEIKAYGIWWVLDTTWYHPMPCPRPRLLYRLEGRVKYERIISYDEFWSNPVMNKFYDCLQTPERSYLFHELAFFRRSLNFSPKMFCEICGIEPSPEFGKRPEITLYNIHNREKPISQRTLRRFILHGKTKQPKKRDIRQTKRLIKETEESPD